MSIEEQFFQKSNKFKQTNVVKGIIALHDNVIVRDMDFSGRQLASGIYLPGDDGKAEGIRPRWGRVYAVGPEQREVKVGQWVYVEHGRWSRGFEVEIDGETFTVRKVDPKCMIFVSDEKPNGDESISTAITGR